jgi:uncharacterized protein (TIGR02246 family)
MSETQSSTAQDEQEIREVIERTFAAWGRADAAAYVADFTEDSDYVAFDGVRQSKVETERSHRALFAGPLYGTRLEGGVEAVRFVTPDVAVVHATGAVVFGWQRKPGRGRASRQTIIAVRRDGRWQLTAFQNTRIRPAPNPDSAMAKLFGRVVRWRTEQTRR